MLRNVQTRSNGSMLRINLDKLQVGIGKLHVAEQNTVLLAFKPYHSRGQIRMVHRVFTYISWSTTKPLAIL